MTGSPAEVMLPVNPMNTRTLFVLTVGVAAALPACGGSRARTKGPEAPAKSAPIAAPVRGGGEGATEDVRTADLDGDGRPDVFKYYRSVDDPERPGQKKSVLVRQDIDLNLDGKVDIWRYFGEDGLVVKEEWDADFDGVVDEVRHFEDGFIVRSERDRNNDGRPDVIRYFGKKGKLERKESDTNGDGQIDRWEYFSGRVLERIGVDKDGDGTVDVWAKAEGQ